MAIPTALNDQISDAMAQTGTAVLAAAPPLAQGTVYQALAHSTGILFESAVNAFHQACMSGQAAANQGVIQIYAVGSMAGATAARRISRIDGPGDARADRRAAPLDAGGSAGPAAHTGARGDGALALAIGAHADGL